MEIIYLIRFPGCVTRFFYFCFFNLKFPSYEKLAMTSQFDLTRFYDFIIRNSVFQVGFLTWEFQIPTSLRAQLFWSEIDVFLKLNSKSIPKISHLLCYSDWLTGFNIGGKLASNLLGSSSAKWKYLKWASKVFEMSTLASKIWESHL